MIGRHGGAKGRYLRVRAGLAVASTLTGLAFVGCEGVSVVSGKTYAVRACNEWTKALDAKTRDEATLHFRNAADSSKTAAKMDPVYEALSGAFDEMFKAYTAGQVDAMLRATDTALDECDKATGVEEKLRQEIEKMKP